MKYITYLVFCQQMLYIIQCTLPVLSLCVLVVHFRRCNAVFPVQPRVTSLPGHVCVNVCVCVDDANCTLHYIVITGSR